MAETATAEKDLERELINILIKMEVIHSAFMGELTLHIGQGPALCDIDRYEKSLTRKKRFANKV